MRLTAKRFVAMLGRLLILGALATFYFWLYYHTPTAREALPQHVDIPAGMGLQAIAATLEEADLIRHRWMFILYVALLHRGPYLQAGEYALRATMSPAQIVSTLRRGKVVQHFLTIPEGLTVREVATLVAAKGLGHPQQLLDLAVDRMFIASLGFPGPSLEGYLFPDTYRVPRGMPERDLLMLMVRTLQEHYTQDIAAQAERLGLSQHEVLTIRPAVKPEARAR